MRSLPAISSQMYKGLTFKYYQVRHNGRTVTTGVRQGWAHGEHEGNGGTGGWCDDGRTSTAGDISLYLDLACTPTGRWLVLLWYLVL